MILTIRPRYLSSAAVDWLVRNSSRAISMKAVSFVRKDRPSFQNENEYENEISQYEVVRALEPASFWLEKVVAVVILLRVSARMSQWRKYVINGKKFYHFAIDQERA